MSLAVWLGAVRKCSAAVVGLDLVLGLSMVRRCSLKRSFKRRFVSPMYCKSQRLHWIMYFTGQVRFNRTRFTGGEEGIVSKTIGNVWASGAIFTATIRAGRELWVGI